MNFIQRRFVLENLPALQGIEFKTIHASKGLEYHNVAIACGSRSEREESDDFPNLSYVAITRAENDLMITSQGAFPQIIENALEHCKAFQNLPAPSVN
ncbi:ATP-binding domain-containing protein [Vogesella urethralis]|uniref:ATP-binding domain-containing protein n=1 Tax=Vogesella urethralis TaxID=2592656 RepID=UPI001185E733